MRHSFISLPAGFAVMPPDRFGGYTPAGCVHPAM